MTFSLVARSPEGAFGMVICSSSPAVASRCTHLRSGVGAVASQNVTNPQLGAIGLNALAAGGDARRTLQAILAQERFPEHRQVVVVDTAGNTAVHTGEKALGIHHAEQTDQAAAAGNMLHDPGVIRSLLFGYVSSGADSFEERLLDGLSAAVTAGGEAGPVHSAGIHVVEDVPWPVTDLRVDWRDNPADELRRLWRVWQPQKADYRTRGLNPETAPSYGVPGDL